LVSRNYILSDLDQPPGNISNAIFVSDILDKYLEIVNEFAERAKKSISDLRIEPWSKLVSSVAEDARLFIDQYKYLMVKSLMGQITPGSNIEFLEGEPGNYPD
jgi:hypothetical protein